MAAASRRELLDYHTAVVSVAGKFLVPPAGHIPSACLSAAIAAMTRTAAAVEVDWRGLEIGCEAD